MADFKISLVEPETTQITQSSEIHATVGGTNNYPVLNDKPQINGVELVGNKTSEELGVVAKEDVSESVIGNKVVQRNANAEILVPTNPKSVNAAVNKNYVDTTLADYAKNADLDNKLNRSTEGGFRIYADSNGKDTLLAYTDSSVGNTIPIRRDNNNFQVGTPKKGGECANKNYVDDIASSLAGQNEYIGSFQGSDYTAETIQSVLTTFVELNTNPSRTARNGDIINIVNGIYGGQQWIYNGNEAVWKYYIDFQNHSVIDSLTSDSAVDGLAAKQGKQLKYEIDDINTNLTENYVKNTDYATASKVGLIYANANYGVRMEDGGSLRTYPAGENDIDTRHFYRPITPNKLDYAVKTGLTTNTIELTDAEKAAAQTWLGVDAKISEVESKIPTFSATELEDGSYSITL